MISARLFEISEMPPKAMAKAIKSLANEVKKEEERKKDQRDRYHRCMNRKREANVSLTKRESNVSLTEVYISKEVSKKKKVSKTLLPEDWVPLEDHFAHAQRRGLDREFVLAKAKRMHSWSHCNDIKRTQRGWNKTLHDWLDNEQPIPTKPSTTNQQKWNAIYESLERGAVQDGIQGSNELGQPALKIIPSSIPSHARNGSGHRFASMSIFEERCDQDLFAGRPAEQI